MHRVDLVLAQQPVERLAQDARFAGGIGNVAAVSLQERLEIVVDEAVLGVGRAPSSRQTFL